MNARKGRREHVTEAAAAKASASNCSSSKTIPMSDEHDAKNLSDSLAFIRRQLEYFQATAEDVEIRKKKGGRHGTVRVGQIGIRCIHCAHRPAEKRSTGAVAFPTSTGMVYQAVRNWQRYHFTKCPDISEEIKAELKSFKRSHSGKDIEKYWTDSCHRKGLVNGQMGSKSSASNREGIFLRDDGNVESAQTFTNESRAADEEEDMKRPGTSDLDIFDVPQDVDGLDLLGIADDNGDKNEIDAPVSVPASIHGSSDTFNFTFDRGLGEAEDELRPRGMTPPAAEFSSAAAMASASLDCAAHAEFEPIPFDPNGQSSEALALSGISPVDILGYDDARSPDVGVHEPLDTTVSSTSAELVSSDRTAQNEIILQKVKAACNLVEAAVKMDGDSSEEGRSGELRVLGRHLYIHFCGRRPEDDSSNVAADKSSSRSETTADANDDTRIKRNKTQGKEAESLTDLGLPSPISNLIENLLCPPSRRLSSFYCDNIQYSSIKDVLIELQIMVRDPDRFLFWEDLPQSGSLNLIDGKLYGREREISELDELFRGLTLSNSRPILLCITGASGTGKSALAMQLRDPTERVGGFFLSEKFDELQQVKQVPVVFSALNTLCSDIARRGGPILQATKKRLESALGSEIQVLMSVIPSLGAIVGQPGSEKQDLSGQAAFMRLLFCVRQMIKCVSCREHPIVLVIDDLQWADEFSLALIEAIASDDETSSFLLVACYRDGEVAEGHPLLRTLRYVDSSSTVRKKIHVDSIDRSSVTTLISDALRIMPSQARPLANLVHSKTGGQPLFVIQFLKSLYEEGLLRYSASSRQWEWEAETISEKNIADTVAEIMMGKMLRYSEEVLMSLKLAACLGHEFDKKTLDLLGPEDSDHSRGPTMSDNLNIAVLDGLLINSETPTTTVYRFSHDQIQLAAYSLISLDEQTALHVQIARLLLSKTNAGGIDSMLFIIVDQFGRGLSLISDRGEKTEVARLCSRAGEKALSFFAHTAAAMFSAQGISLLDEDHWRTDYQLPLALYATHAESNNIAGEVEQVEASAKVIFANARTFGDKLPAYFSLVQATGNHKGRLMKATTIGLDVLRELNIILPEKPDQKAAMMAIEETRAMLERMPTETIFARSMQDETALFAMKMLELIARLTFMARKELMAVIYCRMVQMTIEHGVCSYSIIAIGCYAFLLANSGNLAVGNKYKHLALMLIDRFEAKEAIPQVYGQVYAQMIQIDPVQASFPQLEVGYRTALEYGDRHVYCGVMNREIAVRFFFGDSLQSVETLARAHIQEMDKMQEKNYSISTKLFLQAILNLTNPSCQDPTTLTGQITDQNTLLDIAHQMNYFTLIVQISRHRIHLAYLFRQYDLAASLVDGLMTTVTSSGASLLFLPNGVIVLNTFHVGLVALQIARVKDAEKWLPIATGCMDKMKTWSEASPWNFGHMMQLLEAEHSYYKADHDHAKSAYDRAIRLARDHKFIHDEALCLERAALYYADTCGDGSDLSIKYMTEAREAYIKWGALGKAAAM